MNPAPQISTLSTLCSGLNHFRSLAILLINDGTGPNVISGAISPVRAEYPGLARYREIVCKEVSDAEFHDSLDSRGLLKGQETNIPLWNSHFSNRVFGSQSQSGQSTRKLTHSPTKSSTTQGEAVFGISPQILTNHRTLTKTFPLRLSCALCQGEVAPT